MVVIDEQDIHDMGQSSMSRDVQDDNEIVILPKHVEHHDLNLKLNNDVHNLWIESKDEHHKKFRSLCEMKLHREDHAAQISTPSLKCHVFYDNDDDEYIIQYMEYLKTSSNAITTSPPVLPIENLEVSLILGNEELNTIYEKSDSECILPSCDDFSPIDIPKEKAVTFSNPIFNSNDNFISSDDESLSDEDVPEENVKIYLNPLFEFDNEYISSDVNPLFDEVLENIESNASYDSNLDEPDLLVTPLFDANKNKCFDSGGDVDKINDFEDGYYNSEGDILYLQNLLNDDLVHHDPSIPAMSVASILEGFIDEPPLEENDDLFN
nr:hypothetical protein [Tanacetum cinerariifolium]